MFLKNKKKFIFSDRKYFSDLSVSFWNSDFYLEKNTFVSEINNEKILFEIVKLKNGNDRIYFKNIIKNYSLENYYFKDLTKKQVAFLSKKYYLEKTKKYTVTFHYNKSDFLEAGYKSRKFKTFEKKNNFKILFNYNSEDILKCFSQWKKEIISRGRKPNKGVENDILEILKLEKEFNLKKIFLEIDGKLVGFSFGISFLKNDKNSNHLCLLNYSLYQPRDIQYYLKIKRAELFEKDEFYDSAYSLNSDIGKYKKYNFKEAFVEEFYIVKTGKKR